MSIKSISGPATTSIINTMPSYKSLLGLSALVFFIADIQGGVGPFLAIYFKSELNWDAGEIGVALAAMNAAVLVSR